MPEEQFSPTSNNLGQLLDNLDQDYVTFQSIIDFSETMGKYFLKGWKREMDETENIAWKVVYSKINKTDQILDVFTEDSIFEDYKNIFGQMGISPLKQEELITQFSECSSKTGKLVLSLSVIRAANFNISSEQLETLHRQLSNSGTGNSLIALSKYLRLVKNNTKKPPTSSNNAAILALVISHGISFLSDIKVLQHNHN